MRDCRVKRGADVGSDHHLLMATVKIRLTKQKKPRQTRTKYDVEKLNDRETSDSFGITLANKYDALYNASDNENEEEETVEEEWSKTKKMVLETCEKVLGRKKWKKKQWMGGVNVEAGCKQKREERRNK